MNKMSQSASIPSFEILYQTKQALCDAECHKLIQSQEIKSSSQRKHLGNFLTIWRVGSHINIPPFTKIREQWCFEGIRHSPWLRPLQIKTVYGKESGDYHHPDVKVNAVYLGCMLDRGTFSCQYAHHIGEISASFEHDSKRLIVDFCNVDFRTYPHKFVYEYQDLFDKILVDYKRNTWKLYFFVKVPPRIRRADTYFADEGTKWIRTTTFRDCKPYIIGNSSVICLEFDRNSEKDLNEIIRRFETSTIQTFNVYYAHVSHKAASCNTRLEFLFSEYGTDYALQSFFSLGMVSTLRSNELLRYIKVVQEETNEEILERALYSLSRQLENDHFIDLKEAFVFLLNEEKNKRTKEEVPSSCKYVRRIYCTPTRLIIEQPELMFSNRILRRYGEEFCARIVFRDENYRKLNGTEANSSTDIAERIIEVLSNGVQICNRCYKFLACSNSQLRDHGCWLYAEDDDGNTGETIRKNMGDFRKINIVAKYISRMGQCFSTSESALKVCKQLNIELKPSAFQIRYGGCKGVLAVDPTIPGEKIVIRKSMKKFESDDCDLEKMTESKPGRLFLNYQAITLLSGRGVPDKVFIQLQEAMLYRLANMMLYEFQSAVSLNKHVRNGMAFTMISQSGIALTQEPFFKGMLKALYKHSVGHLKRKARIEIPEEFGRNMIGTIDETASLQYGQVFVQYSKHIFAPQTETIIHKGPVVITKFPALHPGDIRKFEAVDVPSLRHMIDCVVFPQTGNRPHPDEMAGSDLDGDEYFVTWMPQLLIQKNVPPMHFPSSPPKIHYGEIKEKDMIQYISDYIKNDRVGVIANAHLTFADSETDGIFSDVCIELAKKFSKAIDFPKTGSCPELEKNEHPKNYPHFMNKRDKTGYISKKALGQLYTQCRNVESITWQKDGRDEYKGTQRDPHLLYPGHEEYIEEAERIRNEYSHDLTTIMTQYGIENESEIMSGCLNTLSRRITERNERFDTERLVAEKVRNLRKKYRKKFESDLQKEGIFSKEEIERKRYAKASAWYIATYRRDPELLSFPWVMSDVLAQLKNYRVTFFTVRPLDKNPVFSSLSNEIYTYSKGQHIHVMKHSFLTEHQQVNAVKDILVEWDHMLNPGSSDVNRTIALVQHFEDFVFNKHGRFPRLEPSVILLDFLAYLGSSKSKLSDESPLRGPTSKISKKTFQRFCTEAERSYHKLALFGTLTCLFGREYHEQIEQQFTIGPIWRQNREILKRCVLEVRRSMEIYLWYRPIRKGRSDFWFFTFAGSYLQYLELSKIADAWGRNQYITTEPI
ncbi:probable RNA-dependent RNA polymerase 1 isoform X2 [Anneissia japonica]|uniref:probable RNA-dependent RNA polymerase 1 isoform X2 n=1 Tax=Anneissia japonica TaxID=1529436 RepID=UPI0014254E52|nr:probable RNA-dependent RNA polymerase 1 isoform X2 [Anneissia japonica]